MKGAAALLIATALAGCSMDPHYARPEAPVPAAFPTGGAYPSASAPLPTVTYRDIFHDPRLQSLIERALVNNRDLRIAAANILVAREQYRIQRAQQLPQLAATGQASSTGSTGSSTANRASFQLGATVPSFEIDLFGRLASLTRAEQQRYFATEATARATRLTLVGDIADAWLSYATDASLLKIARNTATAAQSSVELTRKRLDGGIAPRTDLRQAEQILDTAQANVAQQTTALAQDINALQLLTGAPVDPKLLPQSIEEAVPTIAALPAGLDSSVLLRRPDVAAAEYQLRAANADIGAARAALFPKITLTSFLGFGSTALAGLFSGGFDWSAAGNAGYTIFNAGAGRANVRQSQAQRNVELATYEKAIQTAFRDVADALARRGTIAEQVRAVTAQTAAAADTANLADQRYRGGIDPYLSSLDAQRSYYAAQQTLATTRLVEGSNLVALYRALGGDMLVDVTPTGPVGATPAP